MAKKLPTLPRAYYTLCIREDGVWSAQFGDYDRPVVQDELIDQHEGSSSIPKKDMKIISTWDTQAAINDGVEQLNEIERGE